MQEGMLYHYLSDRTAGVDLEQIVWTLNEEIHFPLYQQAGTRSFIIFRCCALRMAGKSGAAPAADSVETELLLRNRTGAESLRHSRITTSRSLCRQIAAGRSENCSTDASCGFV